ncbi:hypothetical protein Hypma_003149 [Hypsizygus marmoreus]|uniref:Uncharacterized protein n=1 Tax=Hypsizygus marmoreus TaxID=39966 RepID=A0A369JZ52_HYPMA|nr:hypothetical protein Hypma_003149 [Hypsizygus marmoreus]
MASLPMCYAPHETVLDCIRMRPGKNPGLPLTSSSGPMTARCNAVPQAPYHDHSTFPMGYAPRGTVLDGVQMSEVQWGPPWPRMRTTASFQCAIHRAEPSGIAFGSGQGTILNYRRHPAPRVTMVRLNTVSPAPYQDYGTFPMCCAPPESPYIASGSGHERFPGHCRHRAQGLTRARCKTVPPAPYHDHSTFPMHYAPHETVLNCVQTVPWSLPTSSSAVEDGEVQGSSPAPYENDCTLAMHLEVCGTIWDCLND